MAKTRQTARRSTGGRAPRRQFATNGGGEKAADMTTAKEIMQQQMNIYKETEFNKRTIVVEGQSEILESPNVVHLSFKISIEDDTLQRAIRKCMAKISKIRSIAVNCGVPHENVTSDSIGTEAKKIEYGKFVSSKNEDNSNDEIWKMTKSKIRHQAQSVVRVTLEVKADDDDDDDEGGRKISGLFSRVCYSIMICHDNIVMQEAPKYELSDITDRRNIARRDACINAKEKASFIIAALDDETVRLGKPVCFTDIHCDLEDDADESFCGNFSHVASWNVTKIVEEDDDQEKNREDDVEYDERSPKHPCLEQENEALGIDEISSIFVVPPIKVVACIKAVFEIDIAL